MSSFALRFKSRLRTLGLSQAEFARRCKMSESQVSKYIHNRHVPDRRATQERMAPVLHVDLSWFEL